MRGLLDHRDERISAIDLRATAVTALAMIAVILIGFVVSIARGGSGWPYDMIGFVGGLAYVAAVVFSGAAVSQPDGTPAGRPAPALERLARMTWTAPTPNPVDGPVTGDDRPILEGYLRHQWSTPPTTSAGLTGQQLAERPIPSSNLSLLGLVRHLAKVERHLVPQRATGQDVPPMYPASAWRTRTSMTPRPARPPPRSAACKPSGSQRMRALSRWISMPRSMMATVSNGRCG